MEITQAVRLDEPLSVVFDLSGIVPDRPVVLITASVVEAMYEHASSEMQHEVGGYLLGLPLREQASGHLLTYIEECCKARYESSPTFVTMHAESYSKLERIRGDRLMVGYYHSHPRLGIFLSGTDVRNYQLYHPEAYQIAIVVDPSKTSRRHLTAHSEAVGVFAWKAPGQPVRLGPESIRIVEGRPIRVESVAAVSAEGAAASEGSKASLEEDLDGH